MRDNSKENGRRSAMAAGTGTMAPMDVRRLTPAEHLSDHWEKRRGRTRPRPEYTWYLTYGHSPELHDLASAFQATIKGERHVVPVATPWLHSTLVRPGAADGMFGPEGFDRLPSAPPEPFLLTEAIIFDEGAAIIGVNDTWQAWLNAARAALALDNPDPHVWLHVSLCYTTGPYPTDNLDDRLSPLVSPLASVDAGRPVLTFCELHRRETAYEWTPIAERAL